MTIFMSRNRYSNLAFSSDTGLLSRSMLFFMPKDKQTVLLKILFVATLESKDATMKGTKSIRTNLTYHEFERMLSSEKMIGKTLSANI